MHFHHILLSGVEKTNVGGVINFIEKKIHVPPQATMSNLNPNQSHSRCKVYWHDVDQCFTLH